jgi:hypothetical protein
VLSIDPGDRQEVLSGCDCYVALRHGAASPLWVAEAVSLERPLIAAGAVGRSLGLGADAYYPVSDHDIANGDGTTAAPRPHLVSAAAMMRHVREHPDAALERARVAASMLRGRGSPRAVGLELDAWITQGHAVHDAPHTSADAASDPGATSRSAVERAIVYIQQGPSNPFDAPSRFGVFGRLARRASLRLIRPYTSRRHELDVAVTDAIAELNHRVSALEQQSREPGDTG